MMPAILQVIGALMLTAWVALLIYKPRHGVRAMLIGITIALFVVIGCIVRLWIESSLR